MDKILPPTSTDAAEAEASVPVNVGEPGSDKNPWSFVPALYFMQGIPVVIVQQMSVTMYKTMGVDNAQIGLWTSLIAWPWVVKMLWGPLVDTNSTKRNWIVVMQALIIAGLGFATLGISQTAFLPITLAIFFGIAFLSATHDIAADGFYLLALKEKSQAFFVGVRSAFFRLAMIFGTGFLVVIAGKMEAQGTPIPRTWMAALGIATLVYAACYVYGLWAYPKPASDRTELKVDLGSIVGKFSQVLLMLLGLFLVGRLVVIGAAAVNPVLPKPIFTKSVELTPVFLPTHSDHPTEVRAAYLQESSEKLQKPTTDEATVKDAQSRPKPFATESVFVPFTIQLLISLALIAAAFLSTRKLFKSINMGPAAREYAGQHRILAILSFILLYRFGESMISKMSSPFLLDSAEKGGLAVNTQSVGIIIGTVGIFGLTLGGLLGGAAIAKWGIKKSLWPMVLALNIPNLFYLWLGKSKPKSPLSDTLAADAMPFAHVNVGDPTASVGTWLLDFVVNIPSQIYNLFLLVFDSLREPVGQVIFVDQFGYGFGFSAYMVFLMFLAQGAKMQTSHYAISTGLMALGAMIAGIASGYLQTMFAGTPANPNPNAYYQFFIAVCICTIPGMITLFFIPKDKEDIRRAQIEID